MQFSNSTTHAWAVKIWMGIHIKKVLYAFVLYFIFSLSVFFTYSYHSYRHLLNILFPFLTSHNLFVFPWDYDINLLNIHIPGFMKLHSKLIWLLKVVPPFFKLRKSARARQELEGRLVVEYNATSQKAVKNNERPVGSVQIMVALIIQSSKNQEDAYNPSTVAVKDQFQLKILNIKIQLLVLQQ